jgi:GGDEF domain-containing protein
MGSVAVGFWGAFFGTVGLLLAAALLAATRSARRVALTGSLSALLSAGYVAVYLGWVPIDDREHLLRLQAHVAALCASVLGLMLFWLVGALRSPSRARRAVMLMALLALAVVWGGWLLPAAGALALGFAMEGLVAALALAAAASTALRGGRPGWLAVVGVASMAVTVCGLTWHAFQPDRTPWPLHAVTALAGMGYLVAMAAAMWVRYAYLIEVRQAMVHGPSFDPVTRLRSNFETRLMVGEVFSRRQDGRPLGVLVVSIANLEMLEHLHGRAAYNHGLFVCANRLRRVGPPGVELGRVGEDGFLILTPRPAGAQQLIELAQQVVERLRRPVVLGTSRDMAQLEASRTVWVADVGVGILVAPADMRAATAVAGARAMSRTAWSYASRVACYDEDAKQIAELTPEAAAPAR